jgi:hypothetical protein
MTLTEQAERVGITIVNLSILKNGRARAIRFTTLAASARCSAASLATCSATGRTATRATALAGRHSGSQDPARSRPIKLYRKSCRGRWRGAIPLGYGLGGKRLRRQLSGATRQEVHDKL